MEYLAKNIYYDYRVYQHFLLNNGLDDDSNSITVEELEDFVKNEIDEEEYKDLLKLCQEAY